MAERIDLFKSNLGDKNQTKEIKVGMGKKENWDVKSSSLSCSFENYFIKENDNAIKGEGGEGVG